MVDALIKNTLNDRGILFELITDEATVGGGNSLNTEMVSTASGETRLWNLVVHSTAQFIRVKIFEGEKPTGGTAKASGSTNRNNQSSSPCVDFKVGGTFTSTTDPVFNQFYTLTDEKVILDFIKDTYFQLDKSTDYTMTITNEDTGNKTIECALLFSC